jgi:hypothetical protein
MTAVAGACPGGRPGAPLPRMLQMQSGVPGHESPPTTPENSARLLLAWQPYYPHPEQLEGCGPSVYIVSPRQVGKETLQ